MIAIIDYGAGNLGSVKKAFDYLGVPYRVLSSGEDLYNISGVVLPGVGAFGAAVDRLKSSGFFLKLKNYISSGRPFLGICLGMQLLMESSEEAEGVEGLGVVKGTCRRFRQGKVPQMGWNRVYYGGGSGPVKESRLFRGVPDGSFFYFIHSYYVNEVDEEVAAASSDYYIKFTPAFERGNLYGCQFHPEKSGEMGLQVLRNWVESCIPNPQMSHLRKDENKQYWETVKKHRKPDQPCKTKVLRGPGAVFSKEPMAPGGPPEA